MIVNTNNFLLINRYKNNVLEQRFALLQTNDTEQSSKSKLNSN